jgi:glycosyltransferase involved in cell wall biosynthesis
MVTRGTATDYERALHVGLNLVFLVPGETGGMETYARELIPELVRAAPQARFTAFINREAAAAGDGPWGKLIESVTLPVNARNRIEWVRGEQQLLPRLAVRAGVDVLHSLATTAPAWGRFRRIVTIHDLNYKIVPEAHLGFRGRGMQLLVPLAARRSHRIITDSLSTRRDLENLLGVPRKKVDVVQLGIGTPSAEPMPEAALRAQIGAGERQIVLSVSALRPHKNLARLIGAVARIPPERRPLLALPGYRTDYEQELRRRADELGMSEDVRFLGWVGASELEGLYAASSCFVFPSLYEGFGLPVLEAMARGVPVACSGRGSLDEVAGRAALRFDPESEPDIAAAIERLLTDSAEAGRLRAVGREHAARFTWSATAAGTVAAYERVLAGVRPGRASDG